VTSATIARSEVLQRLQEVFRNVFDDDRLVLRPEMTSRDIPEWDSLNQVKIIIGCEIAFRIRLKAREINALGSVDEMLDHLMAAIAAKA
jgi:acyl carrier protein